MIGIDLLIDMILSHINIINNSQINFWNDILNKKDANETLRINIPFASAS